VLRRSEPDGFQFFRRKRLRRIHRDDKATHLVSLYPRVSAFWMVKADAQFEARRERLILAHLLFLLLANPRHQLMRKAGVSVWWKP